MISTTRRTEIKMLNKLLLLFLFISSYFNEATSQCVKFPNACDKGVCTGLSIATENLFCAPVCMWGCFKGYRECMNFFLKPECSCNPDNCADKSVCS